MRSEKSSRSGATVRGFAQTFVRKLTDYEVAGFAAEDWKKKVRSTADPVWQEPDVDTNIVMAEVSDTVNARYWRKLNKP